MINILKNLFKTYIYIIIYVLIISLFSILNYKLVSSISYISITLLSILLGKNTSIRSNKKGYIIGFITGIIFSISLIVLSILFKNNISLKNIIYYSTLILGTTIGGIVGANKRKSSD